MLNATPFDGSSSTNPEYTFIHIDRYNSGTRGRIWQGKGLNYLSGFWSGGRNKYFQNGWITSTSIQGSTIDYWQLTIEQNMSQDGKIINYYQDENNNFVTNTYDSPGNASTLANMENVTINNDTTEKSDWGCTLALMYNRHLTDTEIADIRSYLIDTYFHS